MEETLEIGGPTPFWKQELSAFGEAIPASRVAAMAKQNKIPYPEGDHADPKSIQEYESATWEYLRQVIFQLVESADESNLKSVVAQLFAENIVRGRGFFAAACMRCQSRNPHLTALYAALAALVNSYFPAVVDNLYRRLSFQFSQMLIHNDSEESMNATIKFLTHLINLHLVSREALRKLLNRCLEVETDDRVKFAVTFFQELRLPGFGPLFIDVHEQFKRIEVKKLKEETRHMVELLVAEENWSNIFNEGPVVSSEWLWVIKKRTIRPLHHEKKRPATNQDIFLDDYKPDKDFLKRERAYYLFRSIVLREGYWNYLAPLPSWEHKNFSYFDRVATKPGFDQQSFICQVRQNIMPEDEGRFFSGIFKYSCLKDDPDSLILVIECLCKSDKRYVEVLETCFLVTWLMIPGSPEMVGPAAATFAKLLNMGLLSWDVVAHLPVEPHDMTMFQHFFLKLFFAYCCGRRCNARSVSENLLRANCPSVRASITLFRSLCLDVIADDLERLWGERESVPKQQKLNFTEATMRLPKAKKLSVMPSTICPAAEETDMEQNGGGARQFRKGARTKKRPQHLNDFVTT